MRERLCVRDREQERERELFRSCMQRPSSRVPAFLVTWEIMDTGTREIMQSTCRRHGLIEIATRLRVPSKNTQHVLQIWKIALVHRLASSFNCRNIENLP